MTELRVDIREVFAESEDLQIEYAFREINHNFFEIIKVLNSIADGFKEVLHSEPDKIDEGMLVIADGVDWNPGDGAGAYLRINSSWVKL